VPVGTFLSGGYDSSLVTAVMQKVSASPVQSFNVGFTEQAFDESAHARAVARHIGTDHHPLVLSVEEARRIIPEIPRHYDEPFGDSSQLPTLLVSRFARQKVKVVLSGDGGDELFCGYRTYALLQQNMRYMPLAKVLAPVRPLLREVPRYEKIQYFDSAENLINAGYLRALPLVQRLLLSSTGAVNSDYLSTARWSWNIQEANMLQDMKLYLPDDILVKVDRATMACGLEGREPLLDYRLFEFSFTLPHHFKYRNDTGKYLLRELTHRYIPRELMERPKQGFAVPVIPWLLHEMADLVDDLTSGERLERQRLFNAVEVQRLISRFRKTKDPYLGRILWNLLVFQLWSDHYHITA
jgi:asparagine synthase (glutamine-hydrolysing)